MGKCRTAVNRILMMRGRNLSGPMFQNIGGGMCAHTAGNFIGSQGGDTEPSILFHAATYDDTTLEALVQKIGVGTPTTTHTATIYALDHEGIYQKFPANSPVWSGARCLLAGGIGTDVVSVHVDDLVGDPLPEQPMLVSSLAATNILLNSNVVGTETVTVTAGTWSIHCHTDSGEVGSAIVTAGTATATGYGTATLDNPVELDVTVGGTISVQTTGVVVANNVLEMNAKLGSIVGPIITAAVSESTDAHIPKYDALNHSDSLGPYVFTFDGKGNDTKVLGEFLYIEDGGSVEGHVDPEFDNPADWTLYSTATISDGKLVINSTLNTLQCRSLEAPTTENTLVYVEAKVSEHVAGKLQISTGVSASHLLAGNGILSFIDTSDRSDGRIFISSGPVDGVCDLKVDYFSVKEVDGKYLKLTDGTTILQHPTALTEGKHQCAVAMEVDGNMDLALNGSWAGEVAYDGTLPILTEFEQGITGNELKRFDSDDLAGQKAQADEEMA